MKKIFAILLAVTMLASMATVVSAAESTTTLTATVPSATYIMNIPADQEIPFGTTHSSIGNIKITDAKGFAVGKNLEVTITYGAFTSNDVTTQIPYTLSLYAEKYSSINSGSYKEKNQELPSVSLGSVSIAHLLKQPCYQLFLRGFVMMNMRWFLAIKTEVTMLKL